MTNQPEWQTIQQTDTWRVRVDKTGVYTPELDYLEKHATDRYYMFTVLLEKCTYVNRVLSDNKFHPNYAAWFADDLLHAAKSAGLPVQSARVYLCSDDPLLRAHAYMVLGNYFGYRNFDDYPRRLTSDQLAEEWAVKV